MVLKWKYSYAHEKSKLSLNSFLFILSKFPYHKHTNNLTKTYLHWGVIWRPSIFILVVTSFLLLSLFWILTHCIVAKVKQTTMLTCKWISNFVGGRIRRGRTDKTWAGRRGVEAGRRELKLGDGGGRLEKSGGRWETVGCEMAEKNVGEKIV